MKAKYHIVTFSWDSGEDDKQDTNTLSEAIKLAKEWIADECYEWVRIYRSNGTLARELRRWGDKIMCFKR